MINRLLRMRSGHVVLLVAWLVMSGCSTPQYNYNSERLRLAVPEFSVMQTLSSLDPETRQRIEKKAIGVVYERLKLADSTATHLQGSRFRVTEQRLMPAGSEGDVTDISKWVCSGMAYYEDGFGRTYYYVNFISPFAPFMFGSSEVQKGTFSSYSQGGGGKQGALDFLEACEVLGAKVRR